MKIDATIASERRILDTTYPLYAVPVGLIPLPVPQICPTRFYNFTEKHYIFKEKCKKKKTWKNYVKSVYLRSYRFARRRSFV